MWAKGLWNRLNGSPGQPYSAKGPFDLPLPMGTEEQRRAAFQQLNVQLDALEKQLQARAASSRAQGRLACVPGACWSLLQGCGCQAVGGLRLPLAAPQPAPALTQPCPAAVAAQDASKARESRLRKAGLQGRARMASELRDMDNDIAALSKALAVRAPGGWPALPPLPAFAVLLGMPAAWPCAPPPACQPADALP